MLRRLTLLLALVTATGVVPTTSAYAWGREGHEVVADIAEAYLSDGARRQVRDLLALENHTNLDQVSSWADFVRSQRPQTGRWHFVDTPISAEAYDAARDCSGGNCVVAKIVEFENVLAASRAPTQERLEALKWVVHFVGDVHQPLHAANDNDKGGNMVPVAGFPGHANLHRIWDTDLLEEDDPDARHLAQRLMGTITSTEITDWQNSSPEDWANESHRIARDVVYGMLPKDRAADVPVVIDAAYRDAAHKVIESQLERAGVRLARVLNGVLGAE